MLPRLQSSPFACGLCLASRSFRGFKSNPALLSALQVVARRTLQLALWLGLSLALTLGCSATVFPRLFSQDAAVLRTMALILPAVVSPDLRCPPREPQLTTVAVRTSCRLAL